MTEPQSNQPNARTPQLPSEDPGAWSLGAAALLLVLFFGAQLAVSVPVAVIVVLSAPRGAVEPSAGLAMSGAVVGVVIFVGNIVFLVLGYLIWIRPRRRPLRRAVALVPSRFPVWIAIPVALATGVLLSVVVHLLREPPPAIMGALLSSRLSIAVFGFALVTIVPLTEEIYFRGILWAAVRRRTSITASVLITSVVFGLMHMTIYGAMAVALLQTFALGAVLAILRARSGSIVPCILGHAVLNVYAVTTFVLFGQ